MKSFLNYSKNRFLYNLIRFILLFILLLIGSEFLFIPNVFADTESTNSLRLLFQANDYGSNSQVNSVNTLDTSLLLNNIYEYTYQPRFLGVYGYINGGFNSGKIYKFQITLNYQQGCGNFNWVSAFANGFVSLYNQGAEITNATYVNATNNSVTIYATAKNMSGNYFDFGYQWNNGLSTNLGYLLDSCPITVSYSNFIISSSTDTGQQQVQQNDIIINQNQTIIDQNNQSNQELNDLNSNITSEDSADTPDFSDLEMADDTPISDLVLMPINYMNKLINSFSNQCTTYSIDFGIFGSDYVLNFPCIKAEKWLGSTLWNLIDMLTCFFMVYEIGMLAVKIFNDLTSLRDTFDSLYSPKHAKPLGAHTSEVE